MFSTWGEPHHLHFGASLLPISRRGGSPIRVQLGHDQAKTGRVPSLVRRDPLAVSLDRDETTRMGPEIPADELCGCMRL